MTNVKEIKIKILRYPLPYEPGGEKYIKTIEIKEGE
jgi:hypothetical protein